MNGIGGMQNFETPKVRDPKINGCGLHSNMPHYVRML
jgi:hypothetical protein